MGSSGMRCLVYIGLGNIGLVYIGLTYIGLIYIGQQDIMLAGNRVHGEIYPSSTLRK